MNTQPPLNGRAAMVIGGSRGIGAAVVRRLARDGADVGFTYVSAAGAADELVAEVERTGRRALALPVDSADAAALAAAVDVVADRFGRLDVLVNNAALYRSARSTSSPSRSSTAPSPSTSAPRSSPRRRPRGT